jgi:hypothetical protein
MQDLLGCISVDDRAPHPAQRRGKHFEIRSSEQGVIDGVDDQALRLVDSIRDVQQPVACQFHLPHAGV